MVTFEFFGTDTDVEPKIETRMELSFKESPMWNEVTDKFLDFLKANGYIFNINDKIRIANDIEPTPWILEEEEVTYNDPAPEAKAPRKKKK